MDNIVLRERLDTMNMLPSFASRHVLKSAYYFLDLDPEPTTSLQVVCGGWESCLPYYRVDYRDFPYFSLELVVAGNGTLTVGARRYRLVPGTVFHHWPGTAYRITSAPHTTIEKYFVYFLGDTAGQFLEEIPFSEREPLYLANFGSIEKLFSQLQTYGASPSSRSPRLCSVLSELLLLQLAETAVPPDPGRSTARASFERCRRFIEDNHIMIRTLDEISTACHLDKPYICRLFKRFACETPYGMLMRLKMDRAADLLLHSNLMVNEIATAVGFDDPYHFSRVFKRVRQLAPTEFVSMVCSSRHPAYNRITDASTPG